MQECGLKLSYKLTKFICLEDPNDITLDDTEEEDGLDESILACTVGDIPQNGTAMENTGVSGNQSGQGVNAGMQQARVVPIAVDNAGTDSLLAQILLQQQRSQTDALSTITERFLQGISTVAQVVSDS